MQSLADSSTNRKHFGGGLMPPAAPPENSFSFLVIEEDESAISTEAWDVLSSAIDEVVARWWEQYVAPVLARRRSV